MSAEPVSPRADIQLSHFELYVEDVELMLTFYSNHLGFVVTDRGHGSDALVFLSRSPGEHHQLVLNPRPSGRPRQSPLDHIAFRTASLAQLRRFNETLAGSSAEPQTVSHGTTWSIYFHDPENNRLELFTDTPWHVDQPCRFDIDLALPDEELIDYTRRRIEHLPGFRKVEEWRAAHAESMAGAPRA